MYVLKLKVGESIKIGDDITVVVSRIRPTRVGIGIDAPPETPVHCEENYLSIVAAEGSNRPGGGGGRAA